MTLALFMIFSTQQSKKKNGIVALKMLNIDTFNWGDIGVSCTSNHFTLS